MTKMHQKRLIPLFLALIMLLSVVMTPLTTPIAWAADEELTLISSSALVAGQPAKLILQYVDPNIHTYGEVPDEKTDIWMWGAGTGNYPEGANTGTNGHPFSQVNGVWQSEPLNVLTGDNIGYIIRFAGKWGGAGGEGPGIDRLSPGNRSLGVLLGDPITKVRVTKDPLDQYTYPSPVTTIERGNIIFRYRDWGSFATNTQHAVTDVKVTVNGIDYPMAYDANTDMFIYTIERADAGNYSYQFSVGDGAPTNDAYNPNTDGNGKSVLTAEPLSKAETIELSVSSLVMEPADAQRVTAIVKDAEGNVLPDEVVTWTTTADAIVRVSHSGVVTATAAAEVAAIRTATITATCGAAQSTIDVTVNPARPSFMWVTSNRYTLATEGTTRTATVDPYIHDRYGYRLNQVGGAMRNGNFTIQWSSSNEAVATVAMTTTGNNTGRCTVTAVAPGTTTVTVTATSVVFPEITLSQSCVFTVTGTGGSVPGPALTAPVTATVIPNTIGYDQSAVLTLVTDTPENIASAVVDMTNLGAKNYQGNALKLPIDMKNGAISLYVAEGIEAGEKTIPVVITDTAGNETTITATVTVDPTIKTKNFDWDEAVVYFMLTDRFYDGDPSNNNAYGLDEWNLDRAEAFHGGDLKGVLQKLDYLEGLGVNTIWITPIVENTHQMQHKDTNQFAYHGYWAKDFTKIDPHLGTVADLDALLDAAHDKGMKIMVDIVMNHAGYPPIDEFMDAGMIRTSLMSGDFMTPLGDGWIRLPDFKTEDPTVRRQLVEWQAAWISHKTAKGNSIDFFRVDTAKHVENGAWQALKNAATAINPQFKMIGEDFTTNTIARPFLFSSGLDALLDFDFATRARNFVGSGTNVGGNVVTVHNQLVTRSNQITNYATLGQFLSSHDQTTFLNQYSNNPADVRLGKGMVAASLQITDKGIPVIYYGEEVMNQTGPYSFGVHSNRIDMKWSNYTSNELAMLEHYKKLLSIRNDYSKVFAKGDRSAALTGSDALKYLVFSRSYKDETLFVGLNTNNAVAENVTFATGLPEGTTMVDLYGKSAYTVGEEGNITISIPAMSNGGTVILVEKEEVGEPAVIELSHSSIDLLVRTSQQVTATVKDAYGKVVKDAVVTWQSSRTQNATVSETGLITGVAARQDVTITARCGTLSKTVSVNVIATPPVSIEISGPQVVTIGSTITLTGTLRDAQGYATTGTITWSSSDTETATISASRVVTGKKPGNVTITASVSTENGVVTDTYELSIKEPRTVIFQYFDDKINTYQDPQGIVRNTTLWTWGMGTSEGGGTMKQFTQVNGIWQTTFSASSADPCVPGFILCLYGKDEKNTKALEFSDRDFTLNPREPYTKVKVSQGVAIPFVYPIARSMFEGEGLVLRYREFDSFATNQQRELEGTVYAVVNGVQHTMTYDAAEDLFKYVVPKASLTEGDYAYQFKVGAEGVLKNDLHNNRTDNQGRSVLTYGYKPMTLSASFGGKTSIGYDENAVLRVTAETEAEIVSITADISELMGVSKKLKIDPEVMAISIPVKEGIAPGVKTVTVTVMDNAGSIFTYAAKITVDDKIASKGFDWDEAIIYFALTDKFYNGDPTNDNAYGVNSNPGSTNNHQWQGGDFKGLTMKLDYLQKLGVNTLWISPIVEQIKTNAAYHGYWAWAFDSLDGHWGTMEDFDELIDEAAERGIKIMVDMVLNHSGGSSNYNNINPIFFNSANPSADTNMIRPYPGFTSSGVDTWIATSLPDFRTEEPWVRNQLVEWQAAWAEHKTAKGNQIAFFRCDTIKHVEQASWMALKNALTDANPNFKTVGEYFNGSFDGTSFLGNGISDGLLDFGFKRYAIDFVNGTAIKSVNDWLKRRNNSLTNYETTSQFINNHDINGFQRELGNPNNTYEKHMLAASLMLTIKGTPKIYYGDELGWNPGTNDSTRRVPMKFEGLTGNEQKMLDHYTKVINIRKDYSKVFAKGDHSDILAGSDAEKFMVFSRSYKGETLYVGLNANTTPADNITLATGKSEGTIVTDLYSGTEYTVDENGSVIINLPSLLNGGTAILAVTEAPMITSANSKSLVYGVGGTFQVEATGSPTITYSLTGAPAGVSINSTSGLITIASTTAVGSHEFTITASNGVLPNAEQTFTLTVTAASSGGNTGGGTPNPTPPPTTTAPASIAVKSTVDASKKSATTEIKAEDLAAAIKHVKGNNKDQVITIETTLAEGVKAEDIRTATVTINQAAVDSIARETTASVVIQTPIAQVSFDNRALETIVNDGGDGNMSLVVNMVDKQALAESGQLSQNDLGKIGNRPVYDFTVTKGDTEVSNFKGGKATINIPYTLQAGENPNAIVVYYIDAAGKLKTMRGSYDASTGTVTVVTTHFSKYAIAYNPVRFNDVGSEWYADAVMFVAAREITSGVGNNNYAPVGTVTRGQFITMLLRAYGIEPATGNNFADAGNTWYTGYLAAAKQMGISSGIGNNKFGPDLEISREEMFTLLYNTLKAINELPRGTGKSMSSFQDSASVSSWANDAIAYLVENGIVSGSGSNLDPKGKSTRGQMAQVLYNLLK